MENPLANGLALTQYPVLSGEDETRWVNFILLATRDLTLAHKVDLPFVFYVSHEPTVFKSDLKTMCLDYEKEKGVSPGIFLLLSTKLGVRFVSDSILSETLTVVVTQLILKRSLSI